MILRCDIGLIKPLKEYVEAYYLKNKVSREINSLAVVKRPQSRDHSQPLSSVYFSKELFRLFVLTQALPLVK